MKATEVNDNPEFQAKLAAHMHKFCEKMEVAKKEATDRLLPFLVTLGTESERSTVVLGAERVHMAVEALLKAFLLPSSNKSDNLFSSDGALATFSRKSEMAYRLGLLDADFKRALELVRRLRNNFAHAVAVESLKENAHANRVTELSKLIAKGNKKTLVELEHVFRVGARAEKETSSYLACIMILLMKLELLQHFVERPKILLPAMLKY